MINFIAGRSLRPSDSSIENESMAYTYTQRFSKIPNDQANRATAKTDIVGTWITANAARQSKAGAVQPKDTQSSDTENASPAIGPKDVSSVSYMLFNQNYITIGKNDIVLKRFCRNARKNLINYKIN